MVVNLPCGGLDLFWDCNHLLDKEVTAIFGPKLKSRAYQYSKAKEKDAKTRFEELYPLVYQSKKMPGDGFITKSFIRSVLSEVYHHSRMNWTLYASER